MIAALILQSLILEGGAGVSPTSSMAPWSDDIRGIIFVETGLDPSPDTGLFYFRFHQAFKESTIVCLLPVSSNAKRYVLPADRYGFELQGTFAARTEYSWRYKTGKACEQK
jgi:hypothetical protein